MHPTPINQTNNAAIARSSVFVFVACVVIQLIGSSVCYADDDEILKKARAIEARRIAVMNKVVTAVAAVFPGEIGKGGGSGVIIHPRGYCLTNFHVVETKRKVKIGLNDGKVYEGDVLSIDPTGDIALVRVRGKEKFDYVELGDSDKVVMGERVFAMGNPFLLATDFQPTITEGIVSGVHRFRGEGANIVYGDCIQTDAAINPGNSGGPLFDSAGKLIGINGLGGFRQLRGRFNVGVGFAASINQIKNFIADLRAGGQIQHGQMDALVREDPHPTDKTRKMVVVSSMMDDSIARLAGIKLGDQVLGINGQKIESQNQYLTYFSRQPKGVLLTLDLRRWNGKTIVKEWQVTMRLKGLPSGPKPGDYEHIKSLNQEECQLILEDFLAHRQKQAYLVQQSYSGSRKFYDSKTGLFDRETGFSFVTLDDKFRDEEQKSLSDTTAAKVTSFDGQKLRILKAGEETATVYDESEDAFASLAFPRQVLYALLNNSLQRHKNWSVTFSGGDKISGVHCSVLTVKDDQDRFARLYIGLFNHQVMGFASLDVDGDYLLETLFDDFKPTKDGLKPHKIVTRRWKSGRVLRIDTIQKRLQPTDFEALLKSRPQLFAEPATSVSKSANDKPKKSGNASAPEKATPEKPADTGEKSEPKKAVEKPPAKPAKTEPEKAAKPKPKATKPVAPVAPKKDENLGPDGRPKPKPPQPVD